MRPRLSTLLVVLFVGAFVVAAGGARADATTPAPRPAKAPIATVSRMTFDNPDYYEQITITFTPDERTGGVVVKWEQGRTVVEKRFDREVRAAIEKEWGGRSFAIAQFPDDRDCWPRDRMWELSRGGERRTVCKSKKAMDRLAGVQSLLALMLRD